MRAGFGYRSLLIRADASQEVGIGHVMRCLALAQGWLALGGEVCLASAVLPSALVGRLVDERVRLFEITFEPGSHDDAVQSTKLAQKTGAPWIVVDGYQFNAEFQRAFKNAGLKQLFIDDYGHAIHYSADLILNQNISADASIYANRESATKLLLGAEFALLRSEFWPWRGWRRRVATAARRVLVTLGGTDPNKVSLLVIEALLALHTNALEVVIVGGSKNDNIEELTSKAAVSGSSFRIVYSPADMSELMAWADVAISAGGSTNWELAFMGVPTLVISTAENQRALAASLDESGVSVHLGWYDKLPVVQIRQGIKWLLEDHRARAEMSQKGQALIDGWGVNRVIASMGPTSETPAS